MIQVIMMRCVLWVVNAKIIKKIIRPNIFLPHKKKSPPWKVGIFPATGWPLSLFLVENQFVHLTMAAVSDANKVDSSRQMAHVDSKSFIVSHPAPALTPVEVDKGHN